MINHNSAVPKYIQLAEKLEKEISNGVFKSNERLYSENELCRKYDVSRITVRQALALLEKKDLIYTVHGKGTFVKLPTLGQSLMKIVSFSKMLSLKNLEGCTQIKSFNKYSSNPQAEELLKITDSPLSKLELIAFVENSPVAFYESYMRGDIGEKLHRNAVEFEVSKKPFTTYDLYGGTGITLGHVEQTISAENLSRELSELFSLPEGTALVVLESVFYDVDGNPVEYKIGRYRSDIYSFKMTRML